MTVTTTLSAETGSVPRGKAAPGPRGHWLFGCFGPMKNDPLGFYQNVWKNYGDYVRIRAIPGFYFFMLTHPQAIEHILQKNYKNYRKPANLTKSVRLLTGEGLFLSEGDLWLRQRRLMQPAFHRHQLSNLSSLMVAGAEAFLRDRQAEEPGKPVDILKEMMQLALRIAGTTLFSTDITGDADAIGTAYRTCFDYISYRMNTLFKLPAWFPTYRNRTFAQAKKLLDRVVLELIEARRQSGEKRQDLLGMLLAAQDEETGLGMSDQQVKDEVLSLLTAGHETVGATLAWTWYLLGQHLEVQRDLYDEIRGRLQGRSPTLDDLPHLPLTRAVFEEAMRLYPPAWGMPREAIHADEIEGLPIPAKSFIFFCLYVTHRHPDFWPDPERFKPERFLPAHAADRPKFAYFPFGGGPRVCIGNNFALMEGPLVLATILQQFRVELLPGQLIVPDPTFTLRPKYGVKVALWPRSTDPSPLIAGCPTA
jgi:cytochrome P450